MTLTAFLHDLFTIGKVTITPTPEQFGRRDIVEASEVLGQRYEEDAQEMPGRVPDFLPEAALWAAQYLYRGAQLTLLRDLDEEAVVKLLPPYPEKKSAEAIYSIDLSFRYLPDLFNLARGLAPADVLVKTLRETAENWPFSSIGINVSNLNTDHIYENTSLRQAYVDRIIAAKDQRRMQEDRWQQSVYEALGEHAGVLWPELKKLPQTNQNE